MNKNFVQYTDAQKDWWYLGAFTSISHTASVLYDEKKSKCVWGWYFENMEKRKKQLDESFKMYPDHSPTTVIMALLRRDCGVFEN